jgi:hypothetical protein
MNYYKIIDETCIGKLQPYIGLLFYPCIPPTTNQTQNIGWVLVASTNHIDNCSVGLDVIEGLGLGGLSPVLKFG